MTKKHLPDKGRHRGCRCTAGAAAAPGGPDEGARPLPQHPGEEARQVSPRKRPGKRTPRPFGSRSSVRSPLRSRPFLLPYRFHGHDLPTAIDLDEIDGFVRRRTALVTLTRRCRPPCRR